MLSKEKFVKIFFVILLVASNVVNAKATIENQNNSIAIEIINEHAFKKTMLPLHDFQYGINIPKEESSNDPLQGLVSYEHSSNVKIYRYDTSNIIADLMVTDPAMNNRVIWDGQIIFDKIINQLKAVTRKQHASYIINIGLIQPNIHDPKFKIYIVAV